MEINNLQNLYLKLLQHGNSWTKEHRIPGGFSNNKEIIYIIRRTGMKLGLFSYFNVILGKIAYAYEKGYTPVVDMQHFNNSLLCENDLNYKNAWEYFFYQPGEIDLCKAYKSRKIILSDSMPGEKAPNDTMSFFNNENGQLDYWREIASKYIRIQDDVLKHAEKRFEQLIGDTDRVLGVLARGTDYAKLRPKCHPVQPTVDELIKKVKEILVSKECNKIFLATEDKDIVEAFKTTFKDELILNDSSYVEYNDGFLSDIALKDKMKYNVDYFTNIYILSKCNCMVGGRTSGSVSAAVLSKGWEYSYFFDLGTY